MPGMVWSSLLNSPQLGAGTALASSVTLTDVSPAPQFTLPAGFLQVGSCLRLTAWGTFSTTATPTLLLGFYYGGVAGTALCASAATTTASGVSSLLWRLEATIDVLTTGTSGTLLAAGILDLSTSSTALTPIPLPSASVGSSVTIDTTTAKALTVGAQWGTSSSSNTLTCRQFMVESVGL